MDAPIICIHFTQQAVQVKNWYSFLFNGVHYLAMPLSKNSNGFILIIYSIIAASCLCIHYVLYIV